MQFKRKASSGYQIIQLMGLILISLMASALAIDFGYYYAAQNTLQTAADSASLAAITELYNNESSDAETRMTDATAEAQNLVTTNQDGLTLGDEDVIFGFIDPATKTYDPATFRAASESEDYALTGGYNAVRVKVRRGTGSANEALSTIMAKMLGVQTMNTQATSIALLDQTVNSITDGGVRPIYACEAQFNRTMEDGIPDNNIVRIYGDHIEIDGVQNIEGCPEMGSGNWGFADFTDCGSGTVGASTVGQWFASGYPGTVTAGECYSTKPGNFIASITSELNTLITDQTIFPIPLYGTDGWHTGPGGGSTDTVDVSGFAGFQITAYQATGPEAGRYIEGRFTRYICREGCASGNDGNTSPGGAIVKLRLASK
jgi:Flp pilus assembly protein TadG